MAVFDKQGNVSRETNPRKALILLAEAFLLAARYQEIAGAVGEYN